MWQRARLSRHLRLTTLKSDRSRTARFMPTSRFPQTKIILFPSTRVRRSSVKVFLLPRKTTKSSAKWPSRRYISIFVHLQILNCLFLFLYLYGIFFSRFFRSAERFRCAKWCFRRYFSLLYTHASRSEEKQQCSRFRM